MRAGVTALLRAAAAGVLCIAALPATAQNAANGQVLFTTQVVPGKLGCSANACHGNLTTPQNRIATGTSAAAIQTAVGRVSQMQFLAGALGAAQYNDLAAYIAGKLGGTPSYLQVVAMPVPVLDPATLNFAAADLLSTTPTQTVTVTNAANASAPLTLGAIGTTSGSDFAVSGGTCRSGDNLPVGASCTVLVAMTPTAVGTRSATLSVVHNGAAGSSTVALTGVGTGTSPVIALSPPALSFSQTVGSTSSDLRLLIGNTGTGALRLTALRLGGAQASEFAFAATGDCAAGTQLAGGESCAVAVHFTPAGTGPRAATLTVEHNAAGGSSTVALTGFGNATAQPGLMLDANRLELGDQVVASAGTPRVLTLVNNGQAALQLSSLTLSGTQAGEFALGGSCAAGTPVPAQGSCTVTVTLTPAGLGARGATLQIASNAPSGTVGVAVTGTGVDAAAPMVRLSPAALGFGTVGIGASSAPRTAVLTNAGNAALAIAGITTSSTEFKLTHDCPASLAPAARCSLLVSYAPSAAIASELLTITSNAPSSPNRIVLNGTGSSASLAVFDWTEGGAPVVFADAAVGAATEAVLRTLVNKGPGAATVSTLNVVGADAGSFVLGGGSCTIGATLAAGTSCTVGLRFAPSALGARGAVLQVGTTGSNPPELALSGTGAGFAAVQVPLSVDPLALDYRQAEVITGGRSEPLVVRIVNDGTSASTIGSVTTSAGFVVSPAAGADACPGVPWTLAPGAGCRVAVVFAPGYGGTTTGTLTVTTSGGQTSKVALSGAATTQMTNVGSVEHGGGALDARWLLLLALAVLAVAAGPRRARTAATS
jgi:hypothetical protein